VFLSVTIFKYLSFRYAILKDKELNVLSNKFTDVISRSKSIKRDDKCHNVASINKRSKDVTSPIQILL
jgi:hypothetical protein